MVAFSRKGLEETPNTTLVNLMVTSLTSLSKGSSAHRKRKTFGSHMQTTIKRGTIRFGRGIVNYYDLGGVLVMTDHSMVR